MKKLTTSEFITRAIEIHGNKYDYSESVYIGCKDSTKIKCREHNNTFLQKPSHHLEGKTGCTLCEIEKKKQTCLKNYGVEYPLQSVKCKEKQKLTCLKNHGFEYSSQSPTVKEKQKTTNLNKYDVSCTLCVPHFKNKAKQTFLEKYGSENPGQVLSIQGKIKQTNLERYGVENPLQSPKFQEKIKQTCLKRYGVEHINQSHLSKDSLNKLNNPSWLIKQHHTQEKTLKTLSENLAVDPTTVANYMRKYHIDIKHFFRSTGEKELADFISSLDYVILVNNRHIIPPYELDIFIPALNVAIEYNGEYWHKDTQQKDKLKQQRCHQQNILLVTIWENAQWLYAKEETKKSIIKILNETPNKNS